MLLCTLVMEKVAKDNTSQLQLTLNLSSQAGHASIRPYQISATLLLTTLRISAWGFIANWNWNKPSGIFLLKWECVSVYHSAFYQAAWYKSTLTSLKKHKKWQLFQLGKRSATFQVGRCAKLSRRQEQSGKLMNLPSEFEQAVKYVMSVWPGSWSKTESETVFSLHAYRKEITQWI